MATRLLLSILFLTAGAVAQSYDYDAAGRLVRVAYPGGGGMLYAYDGSDNLVNVRVVGLAPAPRGLKLTREGSGGFRLSWQAVSGVASYAVYRSAGDTGVWTEIARTPGLTFAETPPGAGIVYRYRVAAVTAAGLSAWSETVSTSEIETPVDPRNSRLISLDAGGAGVMSTAGTGAGTASGYALVDVGSGEAPYGLAVFQLTQNGVVVGETGVPAVPPSRGSRVAIEYRNGVRSATGQFAGTVQVNTGIAFVNPGASATEFRLTMRSRAGGVIATGTGTMPPGRQTARLVGDLAAIAPGFALPAGFADADGYGTLDIESDLPLSVMALRVTTSQRGDLLFSTTPVADLQQPPENGAVYFPHLPEGGGFNSKIVLISTSSTGTQTGTIRLLDDAGAPFRVRTVDGGTGAEFAYSVAPGGVFVLETDGSLPAVAAGWAIVTPASGQTAPAGSGTFRFGQGGIVTTESGIPTAVSTTRARVYVDSSGGHSTGVALANPSQGATATLQVRTFLLDGVTPVGTSSSASTMTLAALQHAARQADGFVSGLPRDFVGVMEIESSEPFLALTVRSLVNGRGDLLFTTFPVADQTRRAPAPLVFPHLADGGGFRTELILLNAAGPSTSTVRLFDSAGQPLNALP